MMKMMMKMKMIKMMLFFELKKNEKKRKKKNKGLKRTVDCVGWVPKKRDNKFFDKKKEKRDL